MPVLQIRDLDESIYRRLAERARRERRSLSRQAVVALERALREDDDHRARREALLDEIDAEAGADWPAGAVDVAALIREDRER